MKRIRVVFLTVLTLTLLVSASVWEGSASASAGGDLPETGYYAATNSFPRNSIIDITNLENGRTVRVVVARGLENPGLLVVLSPGAAGAVGLKSGSTGRVRMNQVNESKTASLFGGTSYPLGDPDHNPGARLAAEGGLDPALLEEEGVREELAETPAETSPAASEKNADAALSEAAPPPAESKEEVSIAGPPEASPASLPDAAVSAAAPTPAPLETVSESPAEETPPPPEAVIAAAPTVPVETARSELPLYPSVPAIPPAPTATALPPHTVNPGDYEYVLEPSAARIPSFPEPSVSPDDTVPLPGAGRDYAIDPAYVIPSIGEAPKSDLPPGARVDPIPEYKAKEAAATPVLLPPESFVPAVSAAPPPASSPAAEEKPPAPDSSAVSLSPGVSFSAPVISGLEKGRYYVQVAAFSKPDSIESEISKIDSRLPIAVQPSEASGLYVYRLLIGPVNLGESGALLERFKTIYKNAFVRLGS